MKLVLHGIAALVGGLGLLFVIGAQGQTSRLVVGGVLVLAAVALVAAVRLRPSIVEHRVTQTLDVAGPLHLERLECRQCAAPLDHGALRSEHGIAMVTCPSCGSNYQLQEGVKW